MRRSVVQTDNKKHFFGFECEKKEKKTKRKIVKIHS